MDEAWRLIFATKSVSEGSHTQGWARFVFNVGALLGSGHFNN